MHVLCTSLLMNNAILQMRVANVVALTEACMPKFWLNLEN